jgi:hypothetical protein
MEKELLEKSLNINRRKFLSRLSIGLGSAALGSLLIPDLPACRTLHRKQSALFTCFKTARPHNWKRLIISPL